MTEKQREVLEQTKITLGEYFEAVVILIEEDEDGMVWHSCSLAHARGLLAEAHDTIKELAKIEREEARMEAVMEHLAQEEDEGTEGSQDF